MHFPVKLYDKLDVSDSPKRNVHFLSSNIPLSPYSLCPGLSFVLILREGFVPVIHLHLQIYRMWAIYALSETLTCTADDLSLHKLDGIYIVNS